MFGKKEPDGSAVIAAVFAAGKTGVAAALRDKVDPLNEVLTRYVATGDNAAELAALTPDQL